MTNQELKISATYIKKLASYPDAEERIALYLDSLFANQQPQKDNFNVQESSENKAVSSIIYFTQKEIEKMSTTFKKVFIANGLAAHVLKKPSGKNTFRYEIRYRANGYCIIASSTDLRKAKEKFLAKTTPDEIEKYRVQKIKTGQDTFEEIFDEWYMVKEGTITDKALKTYNTNFEDLPEKIKKTPIRKIRTSDLVSIMKDVKPRKYEELRTLFNSLFKYAIGCGIISHNPVLLIPFKRAERQTRDSLSIQEIKSFFSRINEPKYERIKQGAYILYFFGLRPCELDEETHREGNFLITRNRKRKNGKIEYKKIPIPKAAESFIDWNKPLTFQVSSKPQYEWIKEVLNGKTAYNLRHTFSSICQQYVRQEIVDIWIGDSPTRLIGKHYTHFSDEFMQNQMALVNFPTY